ncbi:MAG: sugar phosphate isomerase/epimerase [Isosphaeraceae bacterium]
MGSTTPTRRQVLGLGMAASTLPLLSSPSLSGIVGDARTDSEPKLKIGVASYSFIQFDRPKAIEGLRRLGVRYVSIKDKHLPLGSTASERKAGADEFRAAGITPLSCGVIALTDDPAQIRAAFEYARDAGITTIVCKPTRASLPTLDRLVKEFDLRLAIHNHGPEDTVWPSPLDAWEAVKNLDPRIGLCIDVGHTARCGVEPAKAIRTCAARLFDVHLKDLEGTEPRSRVIEMGRGVLDLRGILQALLDIGYAHHAGIEHEKDMKDPLPGLAESLGFVRGLTLGLASR